MGRPAAARTDPPGSGLSSELDPVSVAAPKRPRQFVLRPAQLRSCARAGSLVLLLAVPRSRMLLGSFDSGWRCVFSNRHSGLARLAPGVGQRDLDTLGPAVLSAIVARGAASGECGAFRHIPRHRFSERASPDP